MDSVSWFRFFGKWISDILHKIYLGQNWDGKESVYGENETED